MNFIPKRLRGSCLFAVSIAALSVSSFPLSVAQTPAVQTIQNVATVSYEDSQGLSYSSTSNIATVTVAAVYSATIEADLDLKAAAGQTVYLAHSLSNQGNGEDTYELTLSVNNTQVSASETFSSLKLYLDSNNNGQPDAGESVLLSTAGNTTVTLSAGDTANLVIAAQVQTIATAGDTYGLTLLAEAQEGTGSAVNDSVTDLTTSQGSDGQNGTVEDRLTITNDAVLVVQKEATTLPEVTDEATLDLDINGDGDKNDNVSLVKYQVNITNVGNGKATNVAFLDATPLPDALTFLGTGVATYAPTVSGLSTFDGDVLLEAHADITDEGSIGFDINGNVNQTDVGEAALSLDVNGNGSTTDSNIEGMAAFDAELQPGVVVQMVFYAAYVADPEYDGGVVGTSLAAETSILNTSRVCADNDNNNSKVGECFVVSNTTNTLSHTVVEANISDWGTATSPFFDEDGQANGVSEQTDAYPGETLLYHLLIGNHGNATDVYDLTVENDAFPTGSVITFYQTSGSAALLDTNQNGTVDSGKVKADTCTDAAATDPTLNISLQCFHSPILVRVRIPADAAASNVGWTATIKVTSSLDSSVSDTVVIKLNEILGSVVDVSNDVPSDSSDTNPVDLTAVDANDLAGTFDVDLGEEVSVDFYITNKSQLTDSFDIEVKGSYDGSSWLGLPNLWTVVFYHAGVDTDYTDGITCANATNEVITSTPQILSNQSLCVVAKVKVPLPGVHAQADSLQASAFDGNSDTDKDHILSVHVSSTITGASDVKMDAFDVANVRSVQLTPTSLANQADRGATVEYSHVADNTGNTVENFEVSSLNSVTGFQSYLSITQGADLLAVGNICQSTPTSLVIEQNDGSNETVAVACDNDSDSSPVFTLTPSQTIPLVVKVMVPSNASVGVINKTTNRVISVDALMNFSALDNTEVITGQVRLYNFSAIDSTCDGVADDPNGFSRSVVQEVEPQQCLIWMLIAVNEGTSSVQSVTIANPQPDFTTFNGTNAQVAFCQNGLFFSDGGSLSNLGDANYPLASEDMGKLCLPDGTKGVANLALDGAVSSDLKVQLSGDFEAGDKVIITFVVQVD